MKGVQKKRLFLSDLREQDSELKCQEIAGGYHNHGYWLIRICKDIIYKEPRNVYSFATVEIW